MRYVEIGHIREEMVLGLPLYGHDFNVLLSAGSVFDAAGIRQMQDLGYAGAYIEDDLSKNIKPLDIVPHDLRAKTVREIMGIFKEAELQAETGIAKAEKEARAKQESILLPLIDDLLENTSRISDIIDIKPSEHYRYYHAANVAFLSMLTGAESGFSRVQLYEIGLAALLHDVGDVFLPQSLLNKRGKLTSEEFEVIKSHSQMGFEYLREHFSISIEACMGALQHHEHYNGTGYPNKLKRGEISLYGRIIALAEVYDALTSSRPFRVQGYPAAAIDYMDKNTGILFDPDVFDIFKSVVALYPSGSRVRLNDGTLCIVTENTREDTARPKLRVMDSPETTIDLCTEENLSIIGIIDD